jgi:hypothetical protein
MRLGPRWNMPAAAGPPTPQSRKSICPAPLVLKMSRLESMGRIKASRLPLLFTEGGNYICTARCLTTAVLIYKKQELAMTMAILWRKKLVLHSILVGVFIGISENPIMLANSERPRDVLTSTRRRTLAWNEQRLADR